MCKSAMWLVATLGGLALLGCQPGDVLLDGPNADALVLSAAVPSKGSSSGNLPVVLSGRGFVAGAVVTVGGMPVPEASVQSSEQLTFTLPARPGALGPVPIAVTNPDGATVLRADIFSYYLGTIDFLAPSRVLGTLPPASLRVIDANQDGRTDLLRIESVGAAATSTMSRLTTYLSGADGTFTAASAPLTFPKNLFVFGFPSDVNGDGKPDLVMGERLNSSSTPPGLRFRPLLSLGDGNFAAPTQPSPDLPFALGFSNSYNAFGDLNQDGRTDIVVCNLTSPSIYSVTTLFGQADGSFALGPTSPISGNPIVFQLGDMNGDKTPELVLYVAGQGLVTYFGQTDGSFLTGGTTPIVSPDFVSDFVLGDVTGDGIVDIISSSSSVANRLRKGKATGLFDGPVALPLAGPFAPRLPTMVDVNQDGKMDLMFPLTSPLSTSALIGVGGVLGNGDGTFGPPQVTLTGSRIVSYRYADLDGDGKLDLIYEQTQKVPVSDYRVMMIKGQGDGTFASYSALPLGYSVGGLVQADFNGDRDPDFAITTVATPPLGNGSGLALLGVGLLSRAADGSLAFGNTLATGRNVVGNEAGLTNLAMSDFDHDGKTDLIGLVGSPFGILNWRGLGDGSFESVRTTSFIIGSFGSGAACYGCFLLGDINHDRKDELFMSMGSMIAAFKVLDSRGYSEPTLIPACSGLIGLLLFDVNQDGLLDVLGACSGSSSLGINLGRTDGSLGPPEYIPLKLAPAFVNAGDVNGDGLLDLVVTSNATNDIAVIKMRSDKTLDAPQYYGDSGLEGTSFTVLSDLNGDGAAEIVLTMGKNMAQPSTQSSGILRVFLNPGDGTFVNRLEYDAGMMTGSFVASDVNRDGKPDLVITDPARNSLTFLMNLSR